MVVCEAIIYVVGCRAITMNIPLIETALRGKFVIPDFQEFASKIDDLYQECYSISGGEVSWAVAENTRHTK